MLKLFHAVIGSLQNRIDRPNIYGTEIKHFQLGTEHLPLSGIEGEQQSWEPKMPRGDKSSYTDKQKRQAEHIEDSYRARGVGEEEAAQRAWATVNKEDHGGKKSGSGRQRKSASKR
jgi:hypothetical protein